MASVRVTCPECNYSFAVAERSVGGPVTCRDCQAEFRVEFADGESADDGDEPRARPSKKPTARTVRRPDTDREPEEWKSDLPVRSPAPILVGLLGVQAVVALLLLMNFFFPTVLTTPSTQPGSYYQDTTNSTRKSPPTTRW